MKSLPYLVSKLGTSVAAIVALGVGAPACADETFNFVTNWYAQAEHGGYYQAQATGLYKKQGLDVNIRMGGPQVNAFQLLAAGQVDCVMSSSDLQVLQMRESGLPVVVVAAMFQKDPQVLIAHDDVKSMEDMRGKTILIAALAHRGFWPWLKAKYGFKDEQVRPYTFNIQPFMADRNVVQQGYLTSEPFAIQRAGGKANTFMLSDYGFPPYANTVACLEKTVKERGKALAAFVRASAEGWKSYLVDPAPANTLIRANNPNMTEEQLAYSVGMLKERGVVAGGDAARLGIGVMTDARAKANYDLLVSLKLLDPAKVDQKSVYVTDFVRDLKVLP